MRNCGLDSISRLGKSQLPRQGNITANDCHRDYRPYQPAPDCLAMAKDLRLWAGFEDASG